MGQLLRASRSICQSFVAWTLLYLVGVFGARGAVAGLMQVGTVGYRRPLSDSS